MKKIIIFLMLAGLLFLSSTKISAQEYLLPYPGMLPDHSLYKIKVLRDKIILWLIRDPIKRAAMHLQMADKELFAALKLAEKDNIALAQQTAFKAEHHMTLFVGEIAKAVYYSNREFPQDLIKRSHQATFKHQELLTGMMARAKGNEQEAFQIIKEFSIRNDQELFKLAEETATPR